MTNWDSVVDLVREAFLRGLIAEETACQAVVLIPYRKGDYCDIGLV